MVGPSRDIPGGVHNQATELARRLAAEPTLDLAFQAINPRLPGPLRRLQAIKYVRTLATTALYIGGLVRTVPGADVVHVFGTAKSSFALSTTPALLVARAFGKAIVLDYHSGDAEDHLRRWRRTAVPTMRLAGAIVVPSEYVRRSFARHGLRARLIRNVLDGERFRFRARACLRPVFLSNRQFQPYCGVDDVLRVFALIQQRVPDARLIVAADGPERPALERLVRELGLRNTAFVGWVPHERMTDLYAQADVLLNASRSADNVPLSIVEASACGLAVVSTDVAGIGELIDSGRSGLLVAPGDHAGLADAALRLLDDPALAARLARAGRSDCARFDWPAVRAQWLDLYAATGNGRSPG
jgi:glycosyltransferase involved in cell wall biosynthesis